MRTVILEGKAFDKCQDCPNSISGEGFLECQYPEGLEKRRHKDCHTGIPESCSLPRELEHEASEEILTPNIQANQPKGNAE